MHAVGVGPEIHRLTDELCAIVHGDRLGCTAAGHDFVQHDGNLHSTEGRMVDHNVGSGGTSAKI